MNYGTKANNLYEMQNAGINVPKFICLSWEELVNGSYDIEQFINEIDYSKISELEKASTSLQMYIADVIKTSLTNIDYKEKLKQTINAIGDFNNTSGVCEFSVRSSTANEDGISTSFAGQFDTYLNVNIDDIEEYILKCCKSLYSVNVLKYCAEQNIPITELKMNIIIQEMIDPEYSGILFTSNPQGLLNESVIVVGPGVGANIVEDKVATTSYYYNTTDDIYYYETQSDDYVILSEERVEELIDISKKIQDIFGDKLDIEFAVRNRVLYILQARKITTIKDDSILILDNSNIVESYPGISLPFTESFVNMAYTGVFKGLCRRTIKNKKYLASKEDVYKNMVGSCNGRIYYKISNWYDLIKGMPFRKKLIKNWQDMLGVSITTYDNDREKISPFIRMGTYINMFKELSSVQKNMDKLNHDFEEINSYFKENFRGDLSNKDLVELFNKVREKVLDNWDITLVNDMYAFIYTGLLKAMLKMDKVENYEQVTNDYISGITNIESVKPIKELLQLSKLAIEKDMVGKDIGLDKEYEKAFYDYIDKYGDRALEELKIESKTFRSNPELLIEKIITYTEDKDKFEKMLLNIESEPMELNKENLGKACLIDRSLIKIFSNRAMKGIQSREISRLNRSRIYGIVRTIILQIGKNYERDGILENYRDVFYLYMDELFDIIEKDVLDSKSMMKKINERKEKYRMYKELPAYSRLIFAGDSFNKNHININAVNIYQQGEKLKGIPCSCGEISGEVLVIKDISEAKNVKDKILVTKMTDPGWVFLLVEAKGIITEKGSLLSHTAIISRELGIPAVVGVNNVCNILKSGDKVNINGNTGEIEVIK